MAKSKRETIILACGECKRQNYTTGKSLVAKTKGQKKEKITLKKHCRWCRKHTEHNEVKI